jgi:hypothetical protein
MPRRHHPTLENREIAARLRGLVGSTDNGDLAATATRLGVGALALRQSVDEVSPVVAVDVLLSAIHIYGVDPTWLLTGEYDSTTHRQLLTEAADLPAVLARLLAASVMRPPSIDGAEHPALPPSWPDSGETTQDQQ